MGRVDPTYVKEKIRANPEWDLAFVLSEIQNDAAPIGWSSYIPAAKCLLAAFDIRRKEEEQLEFNPPSGDSLNEEKLL